MNQYSVRISKAYLERGGKPFHPVFWMKDMYFHRSTADIFIAGVADFTNTETGRIHGSHHGFLFDIRNGTDEFKSFFLRRKKREIFIEAAFWKLGINPGFVKDIDGKETELGNGKVDGMVSKTPFFLDPLDVITKFLPGDIFGIFMKDRLEIVELRTDIGTVTYEGMVRKATE